MGNDHELLDILSKDFGLQTPGIVSREAILQSLQKAVSELLQKNPEYFFQLMYRLDISEEKLLSALHQPENGVEKIAELIYERQLQKIQSRKNFRKNKTDNELEW